MSTKHLKPSIKFLKVKLSPTLAAGSFLGMPSLGLPLPSRNHSTASTDVAPREWELWTHKRCEETTALLIPPQPALMLMLEDIVTKYIILR